MKKKKTRAGCLAAVVTAALLMSGVLFSTAAFAFSEEGDSEEIYIYEETYYSEESEPVTGGEEGAQEGNPEASSGESTGITAEDIRYDAVANRQFITIEDRDGNVFYLIIDYDEPVNESEEQYKTYFLNPVDTDDLASLAVPVEEEETEEPIEIEVVPVCTCDVQCKPGEVDTTCEVCLLNYSSCTAEPAIEETEEEEVTEEAEETEVVEETESKGMDFRALIVVIVLFGAIGIFLYVRVGRGNGGSGGSTYDDDYDYDEYEEPEEAKDEYPEQKEPFPEYATRQPVRREAAEETRMPEQSAEEEYFAPQEPDPAPQIQVREPIEDDDPDLVFIDVDDEDF